METYILLFLLAMTNSNEKARDSLRSLLNFYKENRELFAMLAASQSIQPPPPPAPPEPPHEKSRPQSEIGSLAILEEYLKRAAYST